MRIRLAAKASIQVIGVRIDHKGPIHQLFVEEQHVVRRRGAGHVARFPARLAGLQVHTAQYVCAANHGFHVQDGRCAPAGQIAVSIEKGILVEKQALVRDVIVARVGMQHPERAVLQIDHSHAVPVRAGRELNGEVLPIRRNTGTKGIEVYLFFPDRLLRPGEGSRMKTSSVMSFFVSFFIKNLLYCVFTITV